MTHLMAAWVDELREDLRLAEILEHHAAGSLRHGDMEGLSKRLRGRIEALSSPALIRAEALAGLTQPLQKLRAGTVDQVPS